MSKLKEEIVEKMAIEYCAKMTSWKYFINNELTLGQKFPNYGPRARFGSRTQ